MQKYIYTPALTFNMYIPIRVTLRENSICHIKQQDFFFNKLSFNLTEYQMIISISVLNHSPKIFISTLLLFALPSIVALVSIGCELPYPFADRRLLLTP